MTDNKPKPPPEAKIDRSHPNYTRIDVSEFVEPGEDIDNDGDLWRAFGRYKKQKRTRNLIDWEAGGTKELEAVLGDGQKVSRHSEFHYSFMLAGSRVDYWPSTNKWRLKNKTYFGNFKSLCGFIHKRKNPTPKGTYPNDKTSV